MLISRSLIALAAIAASSVTAVGQMIIHVDPNDSIQAAIDQAVDGDEIVVAPGTYVERINLLGKAITLRSSGGPEVTIIDGDPNTTGGGSVITCESGEDPNTVIEGFSITNGTGSVIVGNSYGGGMYNIGSRPTVTNCTFCGNSADDGGGMWNLSSSPALTNCTFSGCSAGFSGGGMYNDLSSNPLLVSCTFRGNSAEAWAGGMYNDADSNPTLTNCIFSGNSADINGGGMVNGLSSPTLTQCTFNGNSALYYGGGIYNYISHAAITNCILTGNTALTGPQVYEDRSTTSTIYSCIEGGWPGAGNIDADPRFVDPNGPDGIAGTLDDDLRLQSGSPCIDAGISLAGIPEDFEGNHRIVDNPNPLAAGYGIPTVDMGAYEFGSTPLRDFDDDLDADVRDVAIFQQRFSVAHVLADLDHDNDVDGDDFVLCQQRITGPKPQP